MASPSPHQPSGPPSGEQGPDVLLAEADQALAAAVTERLTAAGVRTRACRDGAQTLLEAGLNQPGVVVLGTPLPLVAADTVTRLLAAVGRSRIIVGVGPDIGEEATAALAAGAAAIISRPYRTDELLPFISSRPGTAPHRPLQMLTVGDLELDTVGYYLYVRGRPHRLPTREFELLNYLMERVNQVVSHAELMRELWGKDSIASNSLTVHIRRIRHRITDGTGSCCTIDSVRGIGYRLACHPARSREPAALRTAPSLTSEPEQ